MENLFGKIYFDNPRSLLVRIFSEKGIEKLVKDASKIGDPVKIADSVLSFIDCHLHSKDDRKYFFDKDTDCEKFIKLLVFDLKFLMIMSFYYYQIRAEHSFNEDSVYIEAFKKNYTFRSKRSFVHKKTGNNYLLRRLLPEGKKPKLFQSIIDIGLIMSLYESGSPKTNPFLYYSDDVSFESYILHENPDFEPTSFLQNFKFASFDIASVKKLFEELHATCESLGLNKNDNNARQLDYVKNFITNTSKEAYALLNQFLIERITNLNYISALYSKYPDLVNYDKTLDWTAAFNHWLVIPLFRTRLFIVENLEKTCSAKGPVIRVSSNVSSDYETQTYYPKKDPATRFLRFLFLKHEYLKDFLLPLILTTYHYVMNESKLTIGKDYKFFKTLHNTKSYLFYKYDDDNQIMPVSEIPLHDNIKFSLFSLVILNRFNELTRTASDNVLQEHLNAFDELVNVIKAKSLRSPQMIQRLNDEFVNIDISNPNTPEQLFPTFIK